MFRVVVQVTLRTSILDPQGKAICRALHDLGMGSVEDVRTGKVMALTVSATDAEAASEIATEACRKLLANPVTEDFAILSAEPIGLSEVKA